MMRSWSAKGSLDVSRSYAALLPPTASLILGVGVHLAAGTAPPQADAATYDAIASGLAGVNSDAYYGLHWAIGGLADRGFLYPLPIALIYAIAGHPVPEAVGWIQALLFVPATTALIHVAGREAFSRRVGLVSAWMFAIWFPALWHTGWLVTESLTNLLMAGLLALTAAMLRRRTAILGVAVGAMLAVVALSHSAFLALPWVMVLALFVHFQVFDRTRIRVVSAVLGAFLVVWIPVTLGAAAFGLPRLGQGAQGYGGGGGWTFWAGSRAATDFTPGPTDQFVGDLSSFGQLLDVERRIERGELLVDPRLRATIRQKLDRADDPRAATLEDADYYRVGLENLLDSPGEWPRKLRRNATILFFVPGNLRLYIPERHAAGWITRPWRPLSAVLLMLAVVGIAWTALERRTRLVLALPLIVQVGLLMVFVTEPRYLIPLWSSMFLFAGVGVVYLAEALHTAAVRRLERRRTAADP
jgi:hypothetical protein